jgi:hypothetical protein
MGGFHLLGEGKVQCLSELETGGESNLRNGIQPLPEQMFFARSLGRAQAGIHLESQGLEACSSEGMPKGSSASYRTLPSPFQFIVNSSVSDGA